MTVAAAQQLAAVSLDDAGPVTVWIVVLSFVLVECAFIIGMFLPGDSLLLAAGVVLAQGDHEASAWWLGAVATAVAVLGNQIGYLIGRYTGTRVVARRNGRVLNRANLDRAAAFFTRWGFWAVVVARWIPWVRTLAPLVAGAARMDNRRYIVANAVGAACWVPTLILLGYYGAGLLDEVPWLQAAFLWGTVGFFVIGSVIGIVRYRREVRAPADTETLEDAVEQAADGGGRPDAGPRGR